MSKNTFLFTIFYILSFYISILNISLSNPSNHLNLDLIDCNEYKKNVNLLEKINEGVVKEVWLGKYKSQYITISYLKNHIYQEDFSNNIQMLKSFKLSNFTTDYLGQCENKIIFTKFYSLGNLLNLPIILNGNFNFFDKNNNFTINCFNFCISYVLSIDFLHNSPLGKRVMCDSNDLYKLLTQFLITDDLKIIANDLDALPDSTFHLIKCGNKKLIGNLIAPEQKNNSSYNYKIDIWRIPFVCNWILNLCPKNDQLNNLLLPLNKKCLIQNPEIRITSGEVLKEYFKILKIVFHN